MMKLCTNCNKNNIANSTFQITSNLLYYIIVCFLIIVNSNSVIAETTKQSSIQEKQTFSYEISKDSAICYGTDKIQVSIFATKIISNCIGFDIEFSFDKNKLTPTGQFFINNDLINSNYASYTINNKEGITFISVYLNGKGGLHTFNGSGQLIQIEFQKTPNFSNIDSVVFSAQILESYELSTQQVRVKNGYFKTYKASQFVGNIEYWSNNANIPETENDTILDLQTKINDTIYPLRNGNFSIQNPNDSIEISRKLDDNIDVISVINGNDAYLTTLVVTKNIKFKPNLYQILAMDVNMDKVISAGDISQINKRTVLFQTNYLQSRNVKTDWIFIDSTEIATDKKFAISTTYPQSDGIGFCSSMVPSINSKQSIATQQGCMYSQRTYIGILLGDVDGNFKNNTFESATDQKSLKSDNYNETSTEAITVDLSKVIYENNIIDIPIQISSEFITYSCDLVIEFNNKNLKFIDVNSNDNTLDITSYYNEKDKKLRVTSFTMNEIQPNTIIAYIRVETPEKVITIKNNDFTITQAYINGNSTASSIKSNNALKLLAYPIPVIDKINIIVNEKIDIQILDAFYQTKMEMLQIEANVIQVINLENLIQGSYFIKATKCNSDENCIVKIIKK